MSSPPSGHSRIRRVFTLVFIGMTVIALYLSVITIIGQLKDLRYGLVAGVISQVNVVASDSYEGMVTEDSKAVAKSLKLLRSDHHITSALIATEDGTILARYNPRKNQENFLLESRELEKELVNLIIKDIQPQRPIYLFTKDLINVFLPINTGNEVIGVLYLQSNLALDYTRVVMSFIMVTLLTLLTLLLIMSLLFKRPTV